MTEERPLDAASRLPLESVRDLSGQAGDAFATLDADGRCTWSSDAMRIRPGTVMADAVHPDDAVALASILGTAPAGPVWLRLLSASEKVRWESTVAVPLPDASGWTLQLRRPRMLNAAATARNDHERLDATTGLVDRQQVLDDIAWLLSATPRTGKEIAIAHCDLDEFEAVNARLGRDAGDRVLRIAGQRVRDALRSGDLVARFDGHELLVVLKGVHHLRGAIRVANKIRVAVEEPMSLPGGAHQQTASIGVTLISRGESVDSVLARAEGAMHMARESGGNLVVSNPPI